MPVGTNNMIWMGSMHKFAEESYLPANNVLVCAYKIICLNNWLLWCANVHFMLYVQYNTYTVCVYHIKII